jgi:hypothetical protein
MTEPVTAKATPMHSNISPNTALLLAVVTLPASFLRRLHIDSPTIVGKPPKC